MVDIHVSQLVTKDKVTNSVHSATDQPVEFKVVVDSISAKSTQPEFKVRVSVQTVHILVKVQTYQVQVQIQEQVQVQTVHVQAQVNLVKTVWQTWSFIFEWARPFSFCQLRAAGWAPSGSLRRAAKICH